MRDKYHIHHIRVSGYNSRANRAIEGPHFHVRQALMKAAQGTEASWQSAVYAVCWADRVTVRRRMGCSPYFAVTGSHPILPFDLAEANCLAPPTDFPISTADLIWQRAEALQNRYEAVQELSEGKYAERIANALEFEKKFDHRIKDYHFEPGSVVLMRDSAIAKSLNSKAAPRYKGPLVVISRNRGGAYILAELNGAVMDHPIAAHIRKSWKMLIGAYRCLSVFFHLFSSKYAAMHRYGVSRSPMTAWNFF